MLKDYDFDQGSEGWFNVRLGVVTASEMHKVLSKGQGKVRASYMRKLAAETLTGLAQDSFKSEAMDHGTATELQARAYYEFVTGSDVAETGFMFDDEIRVGYSPDGIMAARLLEIKCPNTSTHIEWIEKGVLPSSHKAQCQTGLMVADMDRLDFVSFDPRIKGAGSFFCVEVFRDDDYIENMKSEVDRFYNDLECLIQKVRML